MGRLIFCASEKGSDLNLFVFTMVNDFAKIDLLVFVGVKFFGES